MGKNKNNKVRVKFIGGNAEAVTGSSILIEYNDKEEKNKKILIECGLNQEGGTPLKDYKNNSKKLDYHPQSISYIFCGHVHIDHIGLLPRLYKEGCNAPIICAEGSQKLAQAMLLDSANIMSRDILEINNRYKKNYAPLYEETDVKNTINHWKEYKIDEKIQLDDNVTFRLTGSGHIINSAQIELWIKNNNRTCKIAITSDLGNIAVNQYYVNNFEPIQQANLLIGECTYSDVARSVSSKTRLKDLEKIKSVIYETCLTKKSKVLIPVFALQRAQCILTYLYDIFGEDKNFNIPILLDSPLAIKITNIFEDELSDKDKQKIEEVLSWKNLHLLKDFSETEQWASSNYPCVFLSASGMMNAGRSVYVASKILPHASNHIIFCGYSVTGTLAWKIKQKKTKTVNIEGKPVKCACGITILNSFSSHMQHDELLNYYSNNNYDKIALVHGNFESKIVFGKELQNLLSQKNKTTKVVIVNKSTEILL
jgi:metallo-beta-lactamase family protein